MNKILREEWEEDVDKEKKDIMVLEDYQGSMIDVNISGRSFVPKVSVQEKKPYIIGCKKYSVGSNENIFSVKSIPV